MRSLPYATLAAVLVAASGQLGAQIPSANKINVVDAWARATPAGSRTGVIYMTLVNSGENADRLLGGTTPLAEKVQFHSNTNDNGVMKMRELTAIDIAPGAKVALKPGGTHAMMVGLRQPLRQDQSFPLILDFEKAGKVEIIVSVGKIGAMEHRDTNGM